MDGEGLVKFQKLKYTWNRIGNAIEKLKSKPELVSN